MAKWPGDTRYIGCEAGGGTATPCAFLRPRRPPGRLIEFTVQGAGGMGVAMRARYSLCARCGVGSLFRDRCD